MSTAPMTKTKLSFRSTSCADFPHDGTVVKVTLRRRQTPVRMERGRSAGEEMPAEPPPEAVHGDPADRQPAGPVAQHEAEDVAQGGQPGVLPPGQPLEGHGT